MGPGSHSLLALSRAVDAAHGQGLPVAPSPWGTVPAGEGHQDYWLALPWGAVSPLLTNTG